ncbi:hypothetical protein NUU61_007454 [Penicillium alfredii]|uniref:Zn(2)-C6 fungal-type domain-containing protein n=1 Tax=Penicillium alfredii TaxID=1506179 RepID=A0A9W9F2Y5_9EURO|nr:uncharacterized protein NUU61_007454 [Penicillium alfredii]KAJ5092584.1 hypothetical protein NUU61_007454 [Penicillium alfredii]
MSNHPPDYDPNRQGPYPPQWNSQDDPAPYPYPPASYPPDHDRAYPYPPPSQYPPSSMAAIHPHAQGQDPYRLPPPPGAYRPDVYAQPPPQVVYQAAAPRQRTAIACRYCRRRKIRCSGFESSQDGRCSNCIRFNQECMFTPVSSQAQAFVPAHAAYPHLRSTQTPGRPGNVTLYGAHGQPLPPQQQPDPTLPPPQGMYQPPYGGAPPLASSMPDPRHGGRRGSGSGFEYPDPTNLAPVTPAGSAPGYQTHTAPSPYYPPHDQRTSPQSAYAYDARHSSSPHSSPYPPMQPPQGGVTPPPTSTPGGSGRGGLNVRDMLNPGDSHGRSSTDSDMLNALNRRGLNQ